MAARKILKTKPKVNDVKPLNKDVKRERDVEVLIKNPEEIRQEDDACDASKEDIKVLDDKIEDEKDVDILSAKAETRAV